MSDKMLADEEKRNLKIVIGPWLDAYNKDLTLFKDIYAESSVIQLPLQGIQYRTAGSYGSVIEQKIKEESPDRKMRIVSTLAWGNKVVAECIIRGTEKSNGKVKETAFITILTFNDKGKIINDRSYINVDTWPGLIEASEKMGRPVIRSGFDAKIFKS